MATVLTAKSDTFNIWAILYIFHTLREHWLLILSPSCFSVLSQNLCPRIAIVPSLRFTNSLPNASILQSSDFFISFWTHPSPPCIWYFTSSYFVKSYFYCCATRANTYVYPHAPLPECWQVCFFFLVGPSAVHKIEASPFSHRPLGCVLFHSKILIRPPYVSKCIFSFTVVFNASLSLSFIIYHFSV